jgi:hypothetical protein
MKPLFLICCALLIARFTMAQVQYVPGPALDNDRDIKMNRMLEGDDKSFYAYRIRSRGRGTSFYVEKYDKNKLQPVFSKEISLDDEDLKTNIINVLYAQDNVYLFKSQYDKGSDKMNLYYQTISSKGQASAKATLITSVVTDHYEFIDLDIYLNPSNTKFMVKSSHKARKDAEYTTDFILLDATAGMNKVWTKTVKRNTDLFFGGFMGSFSANREDIGFIGLHFDDKDNVYYCYTDDTKNSTEKERRYQLFMATLNAADKEPQTVEIKFDDDYWVRDIEFSKTSDNEMVVAGYIKDVIERRGRDLVKVGLFSYKINLASNAVSAKAVYFFDDKMLKALESSPKRSRYFKYKLDYIIPVGDAVYYVGEQYREMSVANSNGSKMYH